MQLQPFNGNFQTIDWEMIEQAYQKIPMVNGKPILLGTFWTCEKYALAEVPDHSWIFIELTRPKTYIKIIHCQKMIANQVWVESLQ